MIKMISELPWTPYGIHCADYATAHKVHKFLREAILDRHVYISKIAGFVIKTNNTFRASTGDYITRHEQIGESYPELMVLLSDKIFLNAGQKDISIYLSTGMNTVDTISYGTGDNYRLLEILYTKEEICRCLKKDTILKVVLMYDCGYKHMSETSKGLDASYFPCNVDFSIADYFRVLPLRAEETIVPIRYYNGATKSHLKDILKKWMIFYNTGNVSMEEKLWMQSFGH